MKNKKKWEKKIPLCFGVVDRRFASGGAQQKYAGEMLICAIKEEISWKKFLEELKQYMIRNKFTAEEIVSAKKAFRKLSNYFFS